MAEQFDARVIHQYEHDTWSRCADDYLDGFAGLTRETLPFLMEAAGIEEGASVLDVGSGPGHVADAIARMGCSVTGVDFSALMIEVARRRFPHIEFKETGAEELPFADSTFDAVISNFVVHHLAHPGQAFRETFRVLKPGGRVAFTVFGNPAEQSTIGAFFEAVEMHHLMDELPHGPLFGVTDLGVYTSMLEDAGLTDPSFDFRRILWRTDTVDPVVESFWSWGNMAALPEDIQHKIDVTTREKLALYQQADGKYAFPHEVLLGSAQRP